MHVSGLAGAVPFIALAACATATPTVRLHPQAQERLGAARTIGVVLPKVMVFELTAGGKREPKDDWSAAARGNVSSAVVNELQSAGYETKLLEPNADVKDDLDDVRLLYEAVEASIIYSTYGQKFPAKVNQFDFSLGDVSKLLERLGVDLLAIPYASDEIASAGRVAAQTVGVLSAAVLGVGWVQRGGTTFVNLAIVDRTGAVLWFNLRAGSGTYDLRDPVSTRQIVAAVVKDLPGARR